MWGISLHPGQHEGLISAQTYQRMQERLNGINRAPNRKNLNADFPLRGFVLCGDCNTPLTACWAKGRISYHAYYHCPKRGCPSYGQSIRRDKIEGEFEELLRSVQPTERLFKVARAMFFDLWNRQLAQAEMQAKALAGQLARVERQVVQLIERIVETNIPSVIGAYEDRVRNLEAEKYAIKEKMASAGRAGEKLRRST